MEKEKIDRIIDAFRSSLYQEFGMSEEGMVANPPGQGGGFGGSSPSKGPTAGYDPVMKLDGRKSAVKKYINKLLTNREKRKKKKELKKLSNFNPYFTTK